MDQETYIGKTRVEGLEKEPRGILAQVPALRGDEDRHIVERVWPRIARFARMFQDDNDADKDRDEDREDRQELENVVQRRERVMVLRCDYVQC